MSVWFLILALDKFVESENKVPHSEAVKDVSNVGSQWLLVSSPVRVCYLKSFPTLLVEEPLSFTTVQ